MAHGLESRPKDRPECVKQRKGESMGVPCVIRNDRDHEIWMGVRFSGGSGVVVNLLPLQKRLLCARPGEAVISMAAYGSKQKALEDIPDAFLAESRPL